MVKVRKSWKRALASVMTFAMLLTSVYTMPVQAEEATGSEDVATVSENGTSTATNNSGTAQYDASKIDVWDFGAEQLDESIYNNMWDVDAINSLSPNVEPATKGVNIASFDDGNVSFNDGGYPATHRWRTMNTALTRYDEKNKSLNGVTYTGFIYSNKGASADVYVGLNVKAGDIVTYVVSSNGTEAHYVWEAPSGAKQTATYDAAEQATVITFYATEDGVHKLYTTLEKLVVCRIYREHTNDVEVSGKVTAPSELADYSVVFTNTASGAVTEAEVTNGEYTATLKDNYSYDVTLKDANGYVITSEATLDLAKGASATDFAVTVEAVSLHTVSGTIKGLSEEALAAVKITAKTDEIYVPEITITGDTYTTELETNVTYELVVEGINDYTLVSPTELSATADATVDLNFEAKPTYAVTLDIQGATVADMANATFTFTNLNEEGYVYEFTGTENIALRDGVYSVVASNTGSYVQKLTSNVTINGAAVTKSIAFSSDISAWDFTASDFHSAGFSDTTQTYTYNNMSFTGGKAHQNTYLYMGAGTVSVPVKGDCQIQVTSCYQYSFYFVDESEASVGQKTGSTGQLDTFTYDYKGEAGTVDITFLGTSYVNKIEVIEKVALDTEISVGANGDYATVNEALAAVKKMERPNSERVTISIEPGNYEEMLVVDVPNVTLKNSSANPSIELTNKGVDIADGAVRITSYYGHGYSYYSMGSDCKYDEEILQVNKENGYESFTNPGSGTTAGSYWNATVVVTADGFEAEGIIFENSFNQYVSEKAANDVIVAQSSAKEGSVPRASMQAGDTTVQNKAYVERAAALAIYNDVKQVSFDNCKFVGRQDTLYGGTGVTAAFYDCSIYGGTDYIFGGMTAVFAKCDLVFNTSEDKNDVGYITAAQQKAGRGYLMYNCHVTSTTPGVDTASEYTSKAGYLGRPWQANTGEAVFYNTIVDATCEQYYEASPSMIQPVGWTSTLGGESALSVEYGTYEMADGVDNSASRASWASVLSQPTLADGSAISVETFLGSWDAFAGKDMTIELPDGKVDNTPEADPALPSATTEFTLESSALTAFAAGAKADGDTEKAGTEEYFTIIYSAKSKVDSSSKTFDDGYASAQRINLGGAASTEKNAIKFTTNNPATVKVWWVEGGDDNRQMTILNSAGTAVATTSETLAKNATCITTFELAEAGTYYVGGATNNNYIFKMVVTEEAPAEPIVSTLETSALTAFAQNTKVDGDTESAGTDNYFTLIYSAKSKVDSSSKTFDDGYASAQRVNFGGAVSTEKNAIKFTTSNPATVKVWWVEGGDDNRQMAILNSAGTAVATTNETLAKNATCITTFELTDAGTYYLGGATNNNYIFKVEVTETPGGSVKPPRADWSTVAAPVITNVAQSTTDNTKVEVTVNANVGYDGADKITVTLIDANGKEVGKANSSAEKTEHTVSIAPTASGTYTVSVVAIRDGEEDKAGERKTVDFVLPLVAPYVSSATNVGGGDVSVEWNAVPEADKYILTVDGTEISIGTTLLNATVTGLTIGQNYTIKVVAVRGEDVSAAGSISVNVVDEVQRKWSFTAYGSSTNEKNNGYEGNANEGSVTVYSEGGKGKVVPASTDGLAFYYTAMDPETENFTLTATVNVDSWKLSNGQEGFGLMVADAVGPNGDATAFWNNSYQNIATKIEYYHDGEGVTNDSTASKISMKLGLGTIAKTGATAADIADVTAGKAAMPAGFVSESSTLETSAASLGAGTYNLVGNYTGAQPTGNLDELVTTFRLQIQRNNTGYFLRYLDMDGNVIGEKKYYDLERTALTQIDEDNIYVGFFASRNARITVSDIELTTILPSEDAPAEEREIEYVYPVNTIESATIANSANYELVYYGNADGQLIITDANGKDVVNTEFTALTKERKNVTLNYGKNEFTVTFVPDKNYRPGEYKEMTSYDTVTFKHVVEYKTVSNKTIYVSPEGKSSATGMKDDPMDVYTAVSLAKPGQKIVIMEGTYNLSSTVKTERGIDGTADNMIYMIADPEGTSRPVFDFGGKCPGMVLAGDYWYFQGFDVTRSQDAQKGIQVSGSNNVLDNLRTYKNGNTGIQVSRYKGTDEWEDWPANNLILNCTSYLNADKGYEDADGFAAKLTVADGNVFDGCIAAFNADDGWDLFAKVQSGPIGVVTIKNSLAFKNGYVVDENGKEVNAGNGNGFKMGGDSMPGAHILDNSIAFANKAKGIDSNSGPNIQAFNCTSFDNESYNVAFYTNTAVNTAYVADGVLSYKVSNSVAEQFKLKGTQIEANVYGVTNYYFDGSKSANSAGATVSSTWFKNLDTAAAITGITRNADGTINMNGYLELTDEADENVGARMTGTPSAIISVEENDPIDVPSVNPGGSSDKPVQDNEDDDDDQDVEVTPEQGTQTSPEQAPAQRPSQGGAQGGSQGSSQRPAQNPEQAPAKKPVHKTEVKYDKLDLKAAAEVIAKVLETAMTDAVKEATGCDDASELLEYIVNVALEMSNQKGIKADKERTSVVEVTVMVEDETTGEFVPATEENFPEEGVDVTLPYPEGTDKNDKFNIAHLVVLGCNGKTPGSMESVDYKATDDGLVAHIYSASPFIITWEEGVAESNTTVAETPATTEKAEVAADSTVVVEATAAAATAGTNVWGILIAVAAVAVVGLAVGVFVLRRKEDTLE